MKKNNWTPVTKEDLNKEVQLIAVITREEDGCYVYSPVKSGSSQAPLHKP